MLEDIACLRVVDDHHARGTDSDEINGGQVPWRKDELVCFLGPVPYTFLPSGRPRA